MQDKKELRKKAKKIRNSLDVQQISEKIVENVLNLEIYKKSKHIMIFYPLSHEVNLLKLTQDDSKQFYLPKVKGEDLLICPYKHGDELTISKFKTKEPTTNPVDYSLLDIIFVPAMMADKNLHRLGYGGGFYDKFFAKNLNKSTNAKKIVAIANALVVEELPSESFDAKIDMVVTEFTR